MCNGKDVSGQPDYHSCPIKGQLFENGIMRCSQNEIHSSHSGGNIRVQFKRYGPNSNTSHPPLQKADALVADDGGDWFGKKNAEWKMRSTPCDDCGPYLDWNAKNTDGGMIMLGDANSSWCVEVKPSLYGTDIWHFFIIDGDPDIYLNETRNNCLSRNHRYKKWYDWTQNPIGDTTLGTCQQDSRIELNVTTGYAIAIKYTPE